jgi:hypothetical protein
MRQELCGNNFLVKSGCMPIKLKIITIIYQNNSISKTLNNKWKNKMNHMSLRDINSILIYKLENLLKSILAPRLILGETHLLLIYIP